MLYLTGVSNSAVRIAAAYDPRVGLLVQPNTGYRNQIQYFSAWAADNARFSATAPSIQRMLAWAESLPKSGLFLTVPDVLADSLNTLREWHRYSTDFRRIGLPLAFVAQDGCGADIPWAEFEVLFLGGSTAWKESSAARKIAEQAISLNKHVHMGRVNSFRRLQIAKQWGCSSVDGTYIKYRSRLSPNIGIEEIRTCLDWVEVDTRQTIFPI